MEHDESNNNKLFSTRYTKSIRNIGTKCIDICKEASSAVMRSYLKLYSTSYEKLVNHRNNLTFSLLEHLHHHGGRIAAVFQRNQLSLPGNLFVSCSFYDAMVLCVWQSERVKEQSEIADPHQDFFWVVYFMGFRVNPIWLPNHVTNDIICVKLFFLMDRRPYV